MAGRKGEEEQEYMYSSVCMYIEMLYTVVAQGRGSGVCVKVSWKEVTTKDPSAGNFGRLFVLCRGSYTLNAYHSNTK